MQAKTSGEKGEPTQSFTEKQLEAANVALQNGIKIDDLQNDYFKFPPHHFQPDGRPDNDNPYPLNYTDLRSVSIGADQDYLYVKFQFWGNFPDKAPYYNGDLIWSVGGTIENFNFINPEGKQDSAELGNGIFFVTDNGKGERVPLDQPNVGQLSMISPLGKDEHEETLYKTMTGAGMIAGGPGTDYFLSAIPLRIFGIKYGDEVTFSSSTETGSTKYHHVCIDFLLGKEGYLGGSVIKYKLGDNKYEVIKEPTDIMGPSNQNIGGSANESGTTATEYGPNETFSSQYPSCPENLSGILTVSLIDVDQIAAIEPLGMTNGGDHILPVDHVYFNTNIRADALSPKLPVYAPANVTITRIDKHQNILANGTPEDEPEFFVYFDVCKGISFWIEGIHELSPVLDEIYNKSNKVYGEGSLNQGDKATNYVVQLSYAAKVGEIIAWTGGKSPVDSIAVSAFNDNIKLRDDVNYSFYPGRLRTAFCFIDLYNGDLKKSLENKLGFYDMKVQNGERTVNTIPTFIPRTKEPRCGELIQNILGTIQGDWFYGQPPPEINGANLENEGKTLSFIHKNIDPSIAVISVGGNFMRTGGMEFIPNHSGFANREPSEVRADGNVYCYSGQEGLWMLMDGKILVQLVDNNHLKVERQDGDCTSSENFVNPFIYQR